MKKIIHFLSLLIFLVSCNETRKEENKTDTPQNKTEDKISKSEKSVAFNSPCELVSMEDVKRMFAIELPIEMKDVVYTYPTCVYKWKDGKITTSTTFGGQEIISKLPSEVLIVMVKKANEAMFKQSTSIYKQPQDVANVGSLAIWDSRMSQLTFLSNGYLFHVHVRVSKEDLENKEKAMEVSKLIIGKI